jgi:hypothetical protein
MLAAAAALALSASSAGAGYVTTVFAGPEAVRLAGDVLQVRLAGLGADVKVHRATLRVPLRGHERGAVVRLRPVGLAGLGELALRPPIYRSFDATAPVRAWVADPKTNKGLKIVAGGGCDFGRAVLEVSHEGSVVQAIKPVTALRAIHQAGQTFLTWREIDDPVGRDDPTFEQLHNAVMEARKGKPTLTYRVYRSDRPITLQTLGRAERVREVPAYLSCWNFKAVANTEHPNQGHPTMHSPLRPGYNNVRAYKMTRYRITDGGKPLAHATGLAVFTCAEPGRRYYAVTASVGGCEAVDRLGPGASLAQPVDERPAKFPAIIRQRAVESRSSGRAKPTVVDVLNSWLEPPYHNLPTQQETCIVRWGDLPKADAANRRPLFVVTGTYGSTSAGMQGPGWHAARRHLGATLTIALAEGGIWQGFHECIGTLRGYDQGVVHNYPQRRVLAAARWGVWKHDLFVDPQRVYFWSQLGCWALRHGELFAVVMSNGYGNPAIGRQAQNYGRAGHWGPYPQGSKNFLGVNQWEYMNVPKFVRENPTVELPYWLCWPAYGAYPAHTVGDFGFMPWPETIHAMASTKRAFAAVWNSNGPGAIGTLRQFVLRIRRDQSLPAFTNCSLDASPGDGDHADAEKSGGINIHQRWEPETLVDQPGHWEISLHLQKSCPADRATTDVTPRRCQRFKAKPGQPFRWKLTEADGGKVVADGRAVADKWGLVTVERIELTKHPRRLTITAAR